MAKKKKILELTKVAGSNPYYETYIPAGTEVDDLLDGMARVITSVAVTLSIPPEEIMERMDDYVGENAERLIMAAKKNDDLETLGYFKELFEYYMDFDEDEDEYDEDYDDPWKDEEPNDTERREYATFNYQIVSSEIENLAKELSCSTEEIQEDLKAILEEKEENREKFIETLVNKRIPIEE